MTAKPVIAALFSFLPIAAFSSAQSLPQRAPDEDVNIPEFRNRPNLAPGDALLFNGWGVTPAGTHAKISDMPLRMIFSSDHKTLIAVSGGYSNEGLTLLDAATQKVTQFIPIQSVFNGLALTPDGKHILVTGGDKGVIH